MLINMPTETELARLREVFSLVADRENWKRPIDRVVLKSSATDVEIREAVIFFTGSAPTITSTVTHFYPHPTSLVTLEAPAWLVRAEGYYAAIGA